MEDVYNKYLVLLSINFMKANCNTLPKRISNLTNCYNEFFEDEILAKIKRLIRHIQASNTNEEEVKKWSILQVL